MVSVLGKNIVESPPAAIITEGAFIANSWPLLAL